MNDKDVKAYKVLGHSLVFTAHVAAEFPDDFAETVARWQPDELQIIIDALRMKEKEQTNGG